MKAMVAPTVLPLAEHVAVVSGVGDGLGKKSALALARGGAAVVLCARTADRLDRIATEVRGTGAEVVALHGDITDVDYCKRVVDTTIDTFGRVDCLVNVATRGPFHADTFATVTEADLDAWHRTVNVDVFGTLTMTQAVARRMQSARSGSIIFVNTVGVWLGPARQGAYIASKAALLALAQVLATELGPDGIRVNTVAPGWMLGPPVQGLLEGRAARAGTSVQDEYDKIARDLPLRRIPTDAEVAMIIAFLASEASAAITGQCINANGGQVYR
jgi:NAD(P)-dependent dehydrogenase (short-subunit alcohol dehydrogenase family)